jgi:hypothetical protein
MSKPAYVRLVERIPAIRKMQYTDSTGKPRHIGETGAWLLMYLCSELNKDGTFFMTAEAMRELTGTSTVAEIRRLLAGFEQLGLITRTGEEISYLGRGRPSPIYAMTFIPGLWKPEPITSPISSPVDSPQATNRNTDEPYRERENSFLSEIEPEPEPEPDSEPDSVSVVSKSARQEEGGISADEVMRICIELETEGMTLRGAPIQPGIVKAWKADYSRLITEAIAKRQGDTADDVAWHCHNLRTEARTGRKAQGSYAGVLPRPAPGRQLPNAPKGMEGCLVCGGDGYGIVRDDVGVATSRKCVCKGGTWEGETTQVPTQERVSTDQSGNTYIPTPVASADPQSGARDLGDITDQLTRKWSKPIKPLPD